MGTRLLALAKVFVALTTVFLLIQLSQAQHFSLASTGGDNVRQTVPTRTSTPEPTAPPPTPEPTTPPPTATWTSVPPPPTDTPSATATAVLPAPTETPRPSNATPVPTAAGSASTPTPTAAGAEPLTLPLAGGGAWVLGAGILLLISGALLFQAGLQAHRRRQ